MTEKLDNFIRALGWTPGRTLRESLARAMAEAGVEFIDEKPPAEAQPVEKGRGVLGRDMYDMDDFLARANPPPSAPDYPITAECRRCGVDYRCVPVPAKCAECGADLPPSAPVEAEAERAFYAQDFYEEAREGKKPWPAQQPAADSRICRVCDGGPGNDGSCLCGHRKWEQPAAMVKEHRCEQCCPSCARCYTCGKVVTGKPVETEAERNGRQMREGAATREKK